MNYQITEEMAKALINTYKNNKEELDKIDETIDSNGTLDDGSTDVQNTFEMGYNNALEYVFKILGINPNKEQISDTTLDVKPNEYIAVRGYYDVNILKSNITNPEDVYEIYDEAEKEFNELLIEGDVIRGDTMKWEVVDNTPKKYVRVDIVDNDLSYKEIARGYERILETLYLVNPNEDKLKQLQELISNRYDDEENPFFECGYGSVTDFIENNFEILSIPDCIEIEW